jgi:hypothetical protein
MMLIIMTPRSLLGYLPLCLMLGLSFNAQAEQAAALADKTEVATPFKLSAGYDSFSGGGSGTDVNLRYGADSGNYWLGYFMSQQQSVYQWRLGWDHTFGDAIRITPSIQAASQGFYGGSLQVETGDPWFVGAGIGRTNLRPYWNLNFDPNDSYNLSAGHRTADGQVFAVQYVRDNRLNPDQRHLHFYWRQPLPEKQRLTVDLLYKEGLVDDATIHRWGAGVTYDWPTFFLRVTYDPKANFGPDNLWRFATGFRF